MSDVQPHWIRPNEVARFPRCFVYLDCEAQLHHDDKGPVQTWRCAVTAHDHRRDKGWAWRDPEWATHATPADLWRWVDALCKKSQRCVLIAHNLAYDLRIADAFTILPALGWVLDRVRLDSEQTQVRWRHGTRTLLCIDSLAWVPASLDQLGADVGLDKVPLPAWSAPLDRWQERCVRDVEILRTVWRRILDWLHDIDAGVWQPTGAAQSWTVWRHKFMKHKVLVDDDDAVRELERESVWTGRTEVWQHGKLEVGPYTEWDYACAYLHIARDCGLPRRVVGRAQRPRLRDVREWIDRACVLARVRVSCAQPLVPARCDTGIRWPVGTFETVVWDPELRLLVDADALVEVIECVVYDRKPLLKDFADWCLPLALNVDGDVDPIVQRVAKHWSRALVGRFGVRYRSWIPFGEAVEEGVQLSTASDVDTGERFRVLTIGDKLLREGVSTEGENAVPSVMGWIMSEARRRMWVTMLDAGLENVAYVDTDGLLVNAEGDARLWEHGKAGLRRKQSYPHLEIFGPRQCVLGAELRISGVPRRSVRTGPLTFEGEVWPFLSTSLASGDAGSVRVVPRKMTVRGVDNRRQHLPGGATAAFVADGGGLAAEVTPAA